MLTIFPRAGEGYTPKNLLVKRAKHDHWAQKILTKPILFETNILTYMTIPNLAWVKEKSLRI